MENRKADRKQYTCVLLTILKCYYIKNNPIYSTLLQRNPYSLYF